MQDEAVAKMRQDDRPAPSFLGQKMPPLDAEMPFNPFVNKEGYITAKYELAKTILLVPLCMLRVALMFSAFVTGIFFTRVALLGAGNLRTAPLPRWRRKLLLPVRYMGRCVLFLLGYHWIRIKGRPASKREAPVLVCNHVTFVEPMFVFYKHFPMVVTAEENLSYPFMGTIISAMQPITLKRLSRQSRQSAGLEIRRRTRSPEWTSRLMIFPEATTTNGKAMVSFKLGAFTSNAAVQPMVVRYPHVHLDPSWVAVGPSVYELLFRMMTQFHNYMEVEYLPVMQPTKQELKNPKAFAERVRAAMAKALNVSVTEHTFDDIAMATQAQKSKSELDLLEFGRFERLFRMTPKEGKRYLAKFMALDVQKKGVVTLEDLIDHLALPDCEAVRKVYDLFDTKGSGYFNFRQYAAALLFIARHDRAGEAMEGVYKAFDKDEDGMLNAADFASGLQDLMPGITAEQIKALWNRINVREGKFVYRIELLTFLERNPEYVAAFLYANEGLLPNLKAEIVVEDQTASENET